MQKFVKITKKIYHNYYLLLAVIISLFLTVIIEILSRKNLSGVFGYIINSPLMFLLNAFIIFACLAVSAVFKRRVFALTLLAFSWLVFGIINCVILNYRVIPLSAIDIQIFGSALTMLGVYVKAWQVALIIALFALTGGGLVFLWFKAPKYKGKIPYLKHFAVILTAVISIISFNGIINESMTVRAVFPNIADAYDRYGFVYSFTLGVFDRGINRPADYTPEHIKTLKSGLRNLLPEDDSPEIKPNIIMVQLESFFDVNHFANMKYSENPVPFFTELKNNYSGGVLTVPTIGGGTIYTEFEILTGLNLDYFGMVENPYLSELKDKTVESICFDLKKYNYQTHAIHNNSGSFYERHKVLPNLGFDSFTSVEYMSDITANEIGWVKDRAMKGEISYALASTEERDFVYVMTMQTHGKYPSEIPAGANMNIEIDFLNDIPTEEIKNEFRYYINQIREVDDFIRELAEYYADYHEPVVIVFFGDHLPNLSFDESDLAVGGFRDTEYVIWSNYEIPAVNKNLESYGLSAHLFNILNFNGGYINTYNRFYSEDKDYPSGLQYLGYYMVYDNNNYSGGVINQPTQMKMGRRVIGISEVSGYPSESGVGYNIVIKGENFTPYSVVMVNNRKLPTEFIGADALIVYNANGLKNDDIIAVAQIGKDSEILSITDNYIRGA